MIMYVTKAKGDCIACDASPASDELDHWSGNFRHSAYVKLGPVSPGIGFTDPEVCRFEVEGETAPVEGTAITHDVPRKEWRVSARRASDDTLESCHAAGMFLTAIRLSEGGDFGAK